MVVFEYDLYVACGIIPPAPAACRFEISLAPAAFAAEIGGGEARAEVVEEFPSLSLFERRRVCKFARESLSRN
jgi:hypothetical protein